MIYYTDSDRIENFSFGDVTNTASNIFTFPNLGFDLSNLKYYCIIIGIVLFIISLIALVLKLKK